MLKLNLIRHIVWSGSYVQVHDPIPNESTALGHVTNGLLGLAEIYRLFLTLNTANEKSLLLALCV